MNRLTNITITLVNSAKRKFGRLPSNVVYNLRIKKTPTFGINYNPPLTKEEIEKELLFHEELNPHSNLKVYVAPIKRNK